MTEIFVERRWDQPLTEQDMYAMIESGGGCFATHRCEWRMSFLSVDGHDLFCHFMGPDAESVRIALHQLGSPRGHVWAGTIHDARDFDNEKLENANILVSRRFVEPVDFEDIQALEDAGTGCLETHRVRFVRTFFSRDRKRMICLYQAPDAESVRIAQREAKMPVDRVLAFRQFHP